MRLLTVPLILALAVLPAYFVFRRVSVLGRASRRLAATALLFGAAMAVLAVVVERAVLSFTELSFDVRTAGMGSALLATFLLAAPLEEAMKTLVVWPLYRTRRIDGPRLGLCYAVATAAGFASALGIARLFLAPFDWVLALRTLCQAPAHLFFAGVWGYALGARRGQSGGWFAVTWLLSVALHGLYQHIVWGRGPGFLVAVVPLLGFMVIGAASVLREVNPGSQTLAKLHLPEPPRLSLVTEALNPRDQPLMLRWVVLGAFVNVGLMFTLTVAAVALGHRLGVDFSAADESDMTSAGPLALLGSALLASFPVAGYLVRAPALRPVCSSPRSPPPSLWPRSSPSWHWLRRSASFSRWQSLRWRSGWLAAGLGSGSSADGESYQLSVVSGSGARNGRAWARNPNARTQRGRHC